MEVLGQVRVVGPLEAYAAGFAGRLLDVGYAPSSARRVVYVAAFASRWMADRGLSASDLSPEAVELIARSRRELGYRGWRTAQALTPLVRYLAGIGVLAWPGPAASGPGEDVVERFRSYLVLERGLAPESVRAYSRVARRFLGRLGRDVNLGSLSATEVAQYVVVECQRVSPASAKSTVTAMRSFLGFLHAEGHTPASLVSAVPTAANWRLASLPQALAPAQTAALLASCDRGSVAGLRDFAILSLLVRLGLRVGEVAALMPGDVDWRHGEILVRGKGDRQERLPVPVDVGEALVAWVHQGRRGREGAKVFVRLRAPRGGLSSSAVSAIVGRACKRAGIPPVGGHRLRHTVATDLLRAGAGLGEVGQVLRHRRLLTTAIYAKVDRASLRSVARAWPGGSR